MNLKLETMDLMMKRLSDTMDNLVQYITKCNSMVEQQIFDVKKANLLEKLQDSYSYDVVDYDDLDEEHRESKGLFFIPPKL